MVALIAFSEQAVAYRGLLAASVLRVVVIGKTEREAARLRRHAQLKLIC